MIRSLLLTCILLIPLYSKAQTSIFDAARNGDTTLIRKMVELNGDTVNAVDEDGHSPLILAAYHNQLSAVNQLLKLKANVNYSFSQGTALHGAVYKGYAEIVKTLLEYNADVNLADINGSTPLIYATLFKRIEIAKLLHSNGANHLTKDNTGQSAKDYAISLQIKELIEIFK